MTRAVRLGCVLASMIGGSAFAGCGSSTTLDLFDTGPAIGGDSGPGGHDSGMITPTTDSGTITPITDSGTIPGNDAGVIILPSDGGPGPTDTGVVSATDAGTTLVADSGAVVGVMCGTSVCGSTEVCCITRGGGGMMISQACTAPAACTGIPASCDGPEDCASGEACCGSGGPGGMGSASCTAEASCGFIRLCHTTSECPTAGDMCCNFMGASVCSPRCF